MLSIKRILIPTDFSELGACAVDYGSELAKTFSAEVHLLHVIQDPAVFVIDPMALPAEAVQEMIAAREASANEEMGQLLCAEDSPLSVIRTTRRGRPQDQIVEYAAEHEIDLIVIATHGRSGLKHLLMGSVTESVVRLSGCPVLTVRSTKTD